MSGVQRSEARDDEQRGRRPGPIRQADKRHQIEDQGGTQRPSHSRPWSSFVAEMQ